MRCYHSFNELYAAQSGSFSPQSVFNRSQAPVRNAEDDMVEDEFATGDEVGVDSLYQTFDRALAQLTMLFEGCEVLLTQRAGLSGVNVGGFPKAFLADNSNGPSPEERVARFNGWYKTFVDGSPDSDPPEKGGPETARSLLQGTYDTITELQQQFQDAYRKVREIYDRDYAGSERTVIQKMVRPVGSRLNRLQAAVLSSFLGSHFLFGDKAFRLVKPDESFNGVESDLLSTDSSRKALEAASKHWQRRDELWDHLYQRKRKTLDL